MSNENAVKRKLPMTAGARNKIIALAVLAAIFIILNIILGGRFLTLTNIKTIVSHAVFPAFVAWGMIFIFTSGIVDLSLGANVLLSANVGAICAVSLGLGYVGLILGTILCAIVCQHISCRCVVTLKIPSWIAGLGVALVFEAILSQYAAVRASGSGSSVINLGDSYRALGQMPGLAILWLLGLVAAYLLYNRSSAGINIRAIGGNEAVASAMGINKKKTLLMGALIGAVFIGIAAIVQVSYNSFVAPQSGLNSISTIFKALATMLLAQSFSYIVSVPVGVFFSAIVVMAIFNVLTMFGVPSGTGQEICLGIIVILCGIMSQLKYKGVVK